MTSKKKNSAESRVSEETEMDSENAEGLEKLFSGPFADVNYSQEFRKQTAFK